MANRSRSACRLLVGLALATAGLAGLAASSQPDAAERKRRDAGRALYLEHCAACHGTSGLGDGPAAGSLRRRPTDLTGYAKANGGVFPAEKLQAVIDGRGVGSHGSVEMPVWGSVFKTSGGGEAAARERIAAIVAYLRALQTRAGN
jgi:mono/diheme cytochrome c family protein